MRLTSEMRLARLKASEAKRKEREKVQAAKRNKKYVATYARQKRIDAGMGVRERVTRFYGCCESSTSYQNIRKDVALYSGSGLPLAFLSPCC